MVPKPSSLATVRSGLVDQTPVLYRNVWGKRVYSAPYSFLSLFSCPYVRHRTNKADYFNPGKGRLSIIGKNALGPLNENRSGLLGSTRKVHNVVDNGGDSSANAAASQYLETDERDVAEVEDACNLDLARQILVDTFGLRSFRHEQEAVINRILHGKNTLVIFPTGGGKSLCYQIPAIAFGHGITIVVSPLLALMKDQVDELNRLGVPAESLDSTKTSEQIKLIRLDLQEGKLRLLYCAPERLTDESFIRSMKAIPGGVRLVAVDEAHCISEWGRSFRPDYLKVARFVEEVKAERVICLTATATPKVAEAMCKSFSIDNSGIFRTSPYRPNLHLYAETVNNNRHKCEKIFKFLKEHPGPSIIYVTPRNRAEAVARILRHQGFNAYAFHAEMQSNAKQQIQDDFLSSKIHIIVSTIAFGMGINKPDIRNVIHFELPATIEQYSQQIGRAGRDGLTSQCMFYIRPGDFYVQECFARGNLPSKRSVRYLLKDIFDDHVLGLQVGKTFQRNNYIQGQEFDINASCVEMIYAALELQFGLIRAVKTEYRACIFEASPRYKVVVKSDPSLAARAIELFAEKDAKFHHISIQEVAHTLEIPAQDIMKKLNDLEDRGAIVLKDMGIIKKYHITGRLPKTDEQIDDLLEKLYAYLTRREEETLDRTQELVELITGKKCFALALAEHVGMGLPGGKHNCGHCSFCLTGQPVIMPSTPPPQVNYDAIRSVLDACDVTDDPRFLAMVAFGVNTPRVKKLKPHLSSIFACLADHDFDVLLQEFTKALSMRDNDRSE